MKETVEILNTTCNEMLKRRILFSSVSGHGAEENVLCWI